MRLRWLSRWPWLRKPVDAPAAEITGSTIVSVLWECPTKEQCNAEKAELKRLREKALAENHWLKSKIGDGLQ